MWSLNATQGADVVDAWALFDERGKDPGVGVAVGHPDTGYQDHPAIRDSLLGRGFDFFVPRSDALDDTQEGRFLTPGHGTRTGSVIVGARHYRANPANAKSIPISELRPMRA